MANKKEPHSALLECSKQYEVYISAGLELVADGDEPTVIAMGPPPGGRPQAQHAFVKPTGGGNDQITAIVGYDNKGQKAVFLVRLPEEVQIFEPVEDEEAEEAAAGEGPSA